MIPFLLRRIGQGLLALFGISVIIFFLLHIDSVTPVHAMLGKTWTPARGARLARELGLNLPVPVQFVLWTRGLLSAGGVGAIITQALPPTLEMLGLAILLAGIGSILLVLLQLRWANSVVDRLIGAGTGLLSAIPGFVMGGIVLFLLSIQLPWFPPTGFAGPHANPADWAWHEVLPVVTLALTAVGPWTRQLRVSMGELLQEDFVRTARAKGVANGRVLSRHVLRNGLLPFLTQLGISFPIMINTIIALEAIYGMQGAGTALIGALDGFFFAQATTVALVLAAVTVLGSLLTDLAYSFVDPRIQYR